MKTAFCRSNDQLLTVRARNLNLLELNVSGSTLLLIFYLYGYVEGHIILDAFPWTDPLKLMAADRPKIMGHPVQGDNCFGST